MEREFWKQEVMTAMAAVREIHPLMTSSEEILALTAIKEGMKIGVGAYAIYKSGERIVGVMQRRLRDVLEEIDRS